MVRPSRQKALGLSPLSTWNAPAPLVYVPCLACHIMNIFGVRDRVGAFVWENSAVFCLEACNGQFGAGQLLPLIQTNPNSKFSRSTAWPVHAGPRADHSPSACTDDALTQGDCRSLGSIRDLQLGAYVVDMIPYCVMTNLKDPSNFLIGQPS